MENNDIDKLKAEFLAKKTLGEASNLIWTRVDACPAKKAQAGVCVSHYTTLGSLVSILATNRWKFVRHSSERFNDGHEGKKYGSQEMAQRTYQASFSCSTSENAALWALYTNQNPLAVRISIPRAKMVDWVNSAHEAYLSGIGRESTVIEDVAFRDVLYVAVRDEKTEGRLKRQNVVRWKDVVCQCGAESLSVDIKKEEFTGWLKDYEWHFEKEGRMCFRTTSPLEKDCLFLELPQKVLDSMNFVFSPWLPKEMEPYVEDAIKGLLQRKKRKDRFRPSVLQGLLHFTK